MIREIAELRITIASLDPLPMEDTGYALGTDNATRVLSLLYAEVEKRENPVDASRRDYGGQVQFSYHYLQDEKHKAVEDFRQAILSRLRGAE